MLKCTTAWSVLSLRWDTEDPQKQDAEDQEALKERTLYVTSSWQMNGETPAWFL